MEKGTQVQLKFPKICVAIANNEDQWHLDRQIPSDHSADSLICLQSEQSFSHTFIITNPALRCTQVWLSTITIVYDIKVLQVFLFGL